MRGNYNKYHNTIVTVDGIKFHSAKEGARYRWLKHQEEQGLIEGLALQVSYELLPKLFYENGKTRQHAVTYKADFVYFDKATEQMVVEDVKGFRTKEYKLKKKMMLALLGIEIKEV